MWWLSKRYRRCPRAGDGQPIAFKLNKTVICHNWSEQWSLHIDVISPLPKVRVFFKKLNFVDILNDVIEGRPNRLGVSLGDSSDQVKISIATVKQLETTRNLVFLNKIFRMRVPRVLFLRTLPTFQ
jgi:hypothetical protein